MEIGNETKSNTKLKLNVGVLMVENPLQIVYRLNAYFINVVQELKLKSSFDSVGHDIFTSKLEHKEKFLQSCLFHI